MAIKRNPIDSSANLDSDSVLTGFDASVTADTQSLGDGVTLQSHGMVAGETVQQWTADWWRWAVNTPYATSPLTDTTGVYAGVNNSGPMFFVAGTAGGDATREFDVPADKPLLVPLINLFDTIDPKYLENQYFSNPTVLGWKQSAQPILTIDDKPIGNLQADLVRTDFFSLGQVAADSTGAQLWGMPTGTELAPSKAIGYWAVIKGLAAGSTHTIDFGGSSNFGGPVHVHDTIHVV